VESLLSVVAEVVIIWIPNSRVIAVVVFLRVLMCVHITDTDVRKQVYASPLAYPVLTEPDTL